MLPGAITIIPSDFSLQTEVVFGAVVPGFAPPPIIPLIKFIAPVCDVNAVFTKPVATLPDCDCVYTFLGIVEVPEPIAVTTPAHNSSVTKAAVVPDDPTATAASSKTKSLPEFVGL